MSTQQQMNTLSDKAASKLNDLIQLNIDSAKGFREAADAIDDQKGAALKNLFLDIANRRESYVVELKQSVNFKSDKKPEDDGSVKGTMHRWWLDARAKLNAGDPTVVLIEAERGEDAIKERYEEVLKETSGSPVNDLLLRQYSGVKAGHDRIRDLRDQWKKK